MTFRSVLLWPCLLSLAACGRPPAEPKAAPVEPQAAADAEAAPEAPAPDEGPWPPPARTGPMASYPSPGLVDDVLSSERRMQADLPIADHPLWPVLATTRISIDAAGERFRATHSAQVRALAGRRVTLRGYMLPLEASLRTDRFLISPFTPVCFFHPPAEPNQMVEVRLSRPIEAGHHLVEATGVLDLADDGEKGLFFVIRQGSGRIVERVL